MHHSAEEYRRRRVQIGQERCRDPIILLACGPTIGLSGQTGFRGSGWRSANERDRCLPAQVNVERAETTDRTAMGRLEGKVALVMGAGSAGPGWGNGKAAAVLFAREGARVLCVDRSEEAVELTVELIRGEGGTAQAHVADVTVARDIEGAVSTCIRHFGAVDVLDNNVGIVEVGGVADLPEERWNHAVATNLSSCFLAMKYALPVMQHQGGGSIVNISSIASIRYTGINYASYYATKAAVNHLSRTTAAEWAPHNIRVNAILPGFMKTPMVEQSVALVASYGGGDLEAAWEARAAHCPMGRMGDAWDVARAALFLASDDAAYITGVELVVDGGLTLRC